MSACTAQHLKRLISAVELAVTTLQNWPYAMWCPAPGLWQAHTKRLSDRPEQSQAQLLPALLQILGQVSMSATSTYGARSRWQSSCWPAARQ